MPKRAASDSLSDHFARRAERVIQRTTELAYVAGLGLAVSASPLAAQQSDRKESMQASRTSEQDSQPETGTQAQGELQTELDALKASFEERAPQEMIDTFEQGVRDVEALGVLDRALSVGDQAPAFELPTATGETVSLASVLQRGPAVVTFYRGAWCPYCNIQLRSYQQHLDEFRALGAELVAISPEKPDVTADSEEAASYQFPVLSDAGNEVADAFGIRYRLPDELIEVFSGRLDLAERNGDGSWTLPLAATYVIGEDGTIAYSFLSADYRTRAEPAEILAALESLGSDD